MHDATTRCWSELNSFRIGFRKLSPTLHQHHVSGDTSRFSPRSLPTWKVPEARLKPELVFGDTPHLDSLALDNLPEPPYY